MIRQASEVGGDLEEMHYYQTQSQIPKEWEDGAVGGKPPFTSLHSSRTPPYLTLTARLAS